MQLAQSLTRAIHMDSIGIAAIVGVGKRLAWDFGAGLQELRQPDWGWAWTMKNLENMAMYGNE